MMIATAVVKTILTISHVGTWGKGCTIEQIHEQAISTAKGKLEQLLKDNEWLYVSPNFEIEKVIIKP